MTRGGEQFTVADCYLFTVLSWAPFVKLDLGKWPELKRYVDRISRAQATTGATEAVEIAARNTGLAEHFAEAEQDGDNDCPFRIWKDKSGRYMDRQTVRILLDKPDTAARIADCSHLPRFP